ncbi:MAG TPA: hypothetical protein VGL56_09395 [Fimbriimonadaceae bacterium]|jgi:hypothetical protein
MKRLWITVSLLMLSVGGLTFIGNTRTISNQPDKAVNPWDSLPFTAREWARQTLLPYRKIPLKNGGSMSVQEAYDLYLKAGQPPYPDMSTPGLVTDDEIKAQMKLSERVNKK